MQRGSLWTIRNYRWWFLADTTDVLAVTVRSFAVSLLAWKVSHSEAVTGAIVALENIINLVMMPIGGAIADRCNRRRLMIIENTAGIILSVIFTVLVAANLLNTPLLIAVTAAYGLLVGLCGTANDAILKSLVPTEKFAGAQAIRETRESVVGLLGGTAAGFLYRVFPWLPIAFAAVFYAAGQTATLQLPSQGRKAALKGGSSGPGTGGKPKNGTAEVIPAQEIPQRQDPLHSFIRTLREGLAWAMSKKKFMAALAVGATVNIAFTAIVAGAQIYLIAQGTDSILIGLLDSGMGTLTLIGSLLANWVSSHIPTGKLIILSLAFDTLCFIPLIFFHSYTAVLISLSLMGLPLPSLNTGLYGFIFGKTPDTMQGRATAVFETAVGIFGAVTPAAIGPVLQLQYGFTITAVIAAVFAAVSLVISIATSLRTVPRPEKWEDTDL